MSTAEPLILQTVREDVILRELATPEDDQAYFDAIQANPEHFRQFDDPTADKYQTLQAVTDARLNAGNKTRMGIWHDGTFVGTVNARPDDQDGVEVGYWTHPNHTGHGYATLAAHALSKYMAQQHTRVYAEVAEGHDRSMHVLESAGYHRIGNYAGHVLFEFTDSQEQ